MLGSNFLKSHFFWLFGGVQKMTHFLVKKVMENHFLDIRWFVWFLLKNGIKNGSQKWTIFWPLFWGGQNDHLSSRGSTPPPAHLAIWSRILVFFDPVFSKMPFLKKMEKHVFSCFFALFSWKTTFFWKFLKKSDFTMKSILSKIQVIYGFFKKWSKMGYPLLIRIPKRFQLFCTFFGFFQNEIAKNTKSDKIFWKVLKRF